MSAEQVREDVYHFLGMLEDEPTKESRKWVVEQTGATINQVVACEAVLKQSEEKVDQLGFDRDAIPYWIAGSKKPKPPPAPQTVTYRKPTTPPPTAGAKAASEAEAKAASGAATPATPTSAYVPPGLQVLGYTGIGGMHAENAHAPNAPDAGETADTQVAEVADAEVADEGNPFPTSPLAVHATLEDGTVVEQMRLQDGRTAYVPREQTPPPQPMGVGSKISEMMWENVGIQTQAIMKKVGLNPDVFQCYSWLRSKVDAETGEYIMRRSMDIGEFVNWCVKYTMQEAFGYVPGMIAVGPGNIRKYQEAMHKMRGVN